MNKRKLNIGITMGDAAGIGPEVIIKALKDVGIVGCANFVIIGNCKVFAKIQQLCKIRLAMGQGALTLIDVGRVSKLIFGQAIAAYGLLARECLDVALELIKARKIDALITAPVNKHTISQSGTLFRGHTEYLAEATTTRDFAMMLIGGPFKVVLVTRHIALREVPAALTAEKIYQTLRLTALSLKRLFGIRKAPRIGVCGLNPHSGDQGVMGEEEARIIQPAISRARRFANLEGPLAADSLFFLARNGKFDAVCAMYHDQGLIPLKTYAFNQGVNLTLGLPFVRTSPDHGTAYDLAGKNKADPGSMIEAIRLAVKITTRIKGSQ